MRKRIWFILAIIVTVLILGGVIVLPIIQSEMMKVPLTEAIMATRRGDISALRTCFTPDAQVGAGGFAIAANDAIDLLAPYILEHKANNNMRFGGYANQQQVTPTTVKADFTVWFSVEGNDDIPYRRVPIRKTGQVVLVKTGWFTWKIKKLSSNEGEFENALSRHER
ncbi:MAG: hypothetical protein ACYDBB_18475 [Armatimonadota bacterium]